MALWYRCITSALTLADFMGVAVAAAPDAADLVESLVL